MVELADTRDLKSLDGDIVPVRPRLAAPGCAWTQSASKAQLFLLSYRPHRFCLPRPVRGKGEKIGAGPLEKPRGLGYTGNRPAMGRLDSGGEDNAEICTVDENA